MKDGEIHQLSLIVASVEVFTALTEHRPYRDRSFTRTEALVELERQGCPEEVIRSLGVSTTPGTKQGSVPARF